MFFTMLNQNECFGFNYVQPSQLVIWMFVHQLEQWVQKNMLHWRSESARVSNYKSSKLQVIFPCFFHRISLVQEQIHSFSSGAQDRLFLRMRSMVREEPEGHWHRSVATLGCCQDVLSVPCLPSLCSGWSCLFGERFLEHFAASLFAECHDQGSTGGTPSFLATYRTPDRHKRPITNSIYGDCFCNHCESWQDDPVWGEIFRRQVLVRGMGQLRNIWSFMDHNYSGWMNDNDKQW